MQCARLPPLASDPMALGRKRDQPRAPRPVKRNTIPPANCCRERSIPSSAAPGARTGRGDQTVRGSAIFRFPPPSPAAGEFVPNTRQQRLHIDRSGRLFARRWRGRAEFLHFLHEEGVRSPERFQVLTLARQLPLQPRPAPARVRAPRRVQARDVRPMIAASCTRPASA